MTPNRQTPASRADPTGATGSPARRTATVASVLIALAAAPYADASRAGGNGECPRTARSALPLTADATGKAARAALAAAPSLYRDLDVRGATVLWSKPAATAGPRGAEVARQCARRIEERTVVVELRFPRELPSSSLSEGVVFVSRFSSGYRVWEIAH
jgi:hypothetical protein